MTNRTPEPRALVAISPDRQWLVVLDEPGDMSARPVGGWVLWHRSGPYSWGFYNHMGDTGQSAETVLVEWLKEGGE
jgi:hypothetical protein